MKTHYNETLSIDNINETVTLAGWVSAVRDLGGIIFIELRDKTGFFQVVADPQINPEVHNIFSGIKDEFVIQVTGKITKRPPETYNPDLKTGEIEMYPEKVEILSKAKLLPFELSSDDTKEDIRLKYRYLDIRRPAMVNNLKLRHDIVRAIRDYMNNLDFMEVETPILINTTPEGARDYLVPSRVQEGKFYALPQSPQIFKQLLMVGGLERYYQIARCFRDEDLRADRQPEFTQIDCEMSFVEQDDVINLFEGMAKYLFKEIRGVEMNEPFMRMPWADAMKYYGSDKPDLRFGMKFVELMDIMKGHGFPVFDNAAYIGGICAEGAAHYTRKQLDALTEFVKRPQIGAKGMVYARVEADGNVKSSVDKFYAQEVLQEMKAAFNAKPGDLILILSGDDAMKTRKQLNELRLEMGNQLGLRDKNKFVCLWVVDFPMFERDEETNQIIFTHNPFSMPQGGLDSLLNKDPEEVLAYQYDIVCNGVELSSGAVRNHDIEIMKKAFELAGYSEDDLKAKFSALYNAFQYGAPPHAGMAPGVDRMIMLLTEEENIREVIAFPMNSNAQDLLLGSPGEVTEQQLREVHIKLR